MEASEEGEVSENMIKTLTWGVVFRGHDDDAHLTETSNTHSVISEVSDIFSESSDLCEGIGPSAEEVDSAKRNRILR